MSFELFFKIVLVFASLLMILFAFPATKIAVDGLLASWVGVVTVPPSLAATLAILPLLLLATVFVSLGWWLFSGGDG